MSSSVSLLDRPIVGWRGLRRTVYDPFDSVTADLVSTGEWTKRFGLGTIGEDGLVAYSQSFGTNNIAWYGNTKAHYLGPRWVRCLVTVFDVGILGGVFASLIQTGPSPKWYIVVHVRWNGADDEFTLIERYGGVEISTTIGVLSGAGSSRLLTMWVVGRSFKLDVDSGALVYTKVLGGLPGQGPQALAGLYYSGPATDLGAHCVEWDDFDVRLLPYS